MLRGNEAKRGPEAGFTLVELLVVIVILGILAAVVVFAVGGISDRGTGSACATEAQTFQTAVEAYRAQNDDALPAGATAGAVASTLATSRFLSSPNLGYNGSGTEQWTYSTGTGVVTPGSQCG